MANRDTFLTENECKNLSKNNKFEAAKRVIEQAEQLIYAIRDARDQAGIGGLDEHLKQVENLRSCMVEYTALNVICGIVDKLQEKAGDKQ